MSDMHVCTHVYAHVHTHVYMHVAVGLQTYQKEREESIIAEKKQIVKQCEQLQSEWLQVLQ